MISDTNREAGGGSSLALRLCPWLLPLLLYVLVVIPAAINQRFAINPDGIIYIRKAQWLLAGHFWDSVSGYWSQGISWCVALVLKLSPGTDPLDAIHGVLVFWGATWLLACCALLASILPRQFLSRTLAGMAIALTGARLAVIWIAPDLLLGTMLIAYLAAVSKPRLLERRGIAFVGGLFAGLGYLCKSYALPFFVLHYPATLCYRLWCARRGRSWTPNAEPEVVEPRRMLVSLAIGLIAFALPAAPWIGVISHKYGHFTISMVYHHNHMNVATKSELERLPDFCVVPPDPYLCIWEGLDPGPRKDWSPFANSRNFRHQIGVAVDHLREMLLEMGKFDWIGLSLLACVAAMLPLQWWFKHRRFTAVPMWIVLTCGVYSLGFLIVAFESRYIVPIFLPLMIALCLREFKELVRSEAESASAVRSRWRTLIPIALTIPFLIGAYRGISPFLFESPTRPIFADVAKRLRDADLRTLFASSEHNRGVNLAYYLDQKIVMLPEREDNATIQKELAAAKVDEVLVWWDTRYDDASSYPKRLAAMLIESKKWKLAKPMKLDTVRRLDVYIRREPFDKTLKHMVPSPSTLGEG